MVVFSRFQPFLAVGNLRSNQKLPMYTGGMGKDVMYLLGFKTLGLICLVSRVFQRILLGYFSKSGLGFITEWLVIRLVFWVVYNPGPSSVLVLLDIQEVKFSLSIIFIWSSSCCGMQTWVMQLIFVLLVFNLVYSLILRVKSVVFVIQ